MALDTRNKRSSAINVGSPWRGLLPAPDGTVGQPDRQHLAFLYSGISAEAAVATPDVPSTLSVIAMVATPFDSTVTASIDGPPWPLGAIEEVEGGINDFSIAGAEVTVYASDIGYRSKTADIPSQTWFPHRLNPAFAYQLRLFQGEEPRGQSTLGIGNITLHNERGDIDSWMAYGWDGRTTRLYTGEKGAAFSTFTRVFVGTVEGIDWTDRDITIRLRDRQAPFLRQIQTNLYGGGGGIDGDSGVKGRQKPLAYGRIGNAEAVLIDAANLVYQLHDGEIEAVTQIRDKGIALDATGDHATLAALTGASLTASQFATCLDLGLIRLGGSPDGVVTAEFKGSLDTDGTYPETTSSILSLIARTRLGDDNFADADLEGFDTLAYDQPAVIGWHCDESGKRVQDAFDEIASGAGVMWWATPAGMLHIQRLQAPAAPAAHILTRDNIDGFGFKRLGVKASQRRRVGYDRMQLVQDASVLAGGVTDANRQRFGSEYRFATAQDASVLYMHRLAQEVDTPGLFALEADAQAEATRLLTLHGVERGFWTVPVTGFTAFEIEAGDIVVIQDWDRFGLDPLGSYFVVVGIRANARTNTVELTLWG